jgi:hypothetical protein
MERKFLEDLGLEKEAIDKIMAENGKDVETQKAKTTTAENGLTTANKTIKDLQETVKKFDGVDVEKLKKDVADWEQKYNTDTAQMKLDNALEMALINGKAKNTKAVKALLTMDNIKLDGDKLLGLEEQLTELKKNDPYLFDEKKPKETTVTVNSGGEHKDPPDDGKTLKDEITEKMFGTPKA